MSSSALGALVDLYCASYPTPPAAVTLDIDDTVDVVHGHQQLSLFNAHYDERCFLPIHVYDTATGRPVAMLLRPARRHRARRSAAMCAVSCAASADIGRKPGSPSAATAITAAQKRWRGAKRMASTTSLACRQPMLDRLVDGAADDMRTRRALDKPCLRGFAETRSPPKPGSPSAGLARIEATSLGLDIRFVVTSIEPARPSNL